MTSDGDMSLGVMVVAEALGKNEALQGKALVGDSGFLLARQMQKRGWMRNVFRYSNALYCQPPRNVIRDADGHYLPWAADALHYCPYLDKEIDQSKPKVILALGQTAFEKLTGEHLAISAARGYLWREKRGRCWVIPTFHPSFIMRGNFHLALVLGLDMDKAVRLAAKERISLAKLQCICDPRVGDWEDLSRKYVERIRYGVPLAGDIETPYKARLADDEDELSDEEDETYQIDRFSFSTGLLEGVSVPGSTPFYPGVKRVLDAAMETQDGQLLFWNRPFDRPRVAKAFNMALPLTHVRDTMDAWHVLYNCLPKKLGFASSCLEINDCIPAWKHLSGVQPAYYSAMDAVMLWRNDYAILRGLEETGQLQVYKDICATADPLLEQMTLKGLMVDPLAKDALYTKVSGLMRENVEEMQAVVPEGIKKLKVWKSFKLAEKGLALMREKDEVARDATLFELPGVKEETTCEQCFAHPVQKNHVTRKTILTPVTEM